mmetsp:Transcript_54430/g.174531  ORF Transcript_54430/g.174531 Transcript_54430/m.174531 type:complete len:324 (-) Transcript_54430:339-1310(-)
MAASMKYAAMPEKMPAEMEKVRGVTQMMRKAGSATRRSVKSTSRTGTIIMVPMMTRQGAVASGGISSMRGTKAGDARKSTAVVTAQRPVRPPSCTPAADSLWMITGLVPRKAPRPVPRALPMYAKDAPGRRSSLPMRPACWPMPYCTPAVSKTTMNSMQSTMVPKAWRSSIAASSEGVKSVLGARLLLGEMSPMRSLALGRPSRFAATVTKKMPMSRAPFVLRMSSTATRSVPTTESQRVGCSRSPRATSVVLSATTRPMSWKPTKAWKMPMATVIAAFRLPGSIACSQSAAPLAASTAKMAACTKQQESAASALSPYLAMTP